MKKISTAVMVLLLAGCSHVMPQKKDQTLHYQCGTTPLTVALTAEENTASFLMDGERLTLPLVSGARYSDGKYTFWSKGPHAFVERNGRVIMSDCVLASE